jgi:hypothetical protein
VKIPSIRFRLFLADLSAVCLLLRPFNRRSPGRDRFGQRVGFTFDARTPSTSTWIFTLRNLAVGLGHAANLLQTRDLARAPPVPALCGLSAVEPYRDPESLRNKRYTQPCQGKRGLSDSFKLTD